MPRSQRLSPRLHLCCEPPARRADNGINDELTEMTPGRGGRPVNRGARKACTQSLNTHHVILTTHAWGMMAATDGAKKTAPRPRAAARGSRVHTANTVHTHPALTWTTRHLLPRRRATARRVDDGRFGHEGLEQQGTHLPTGTTTTIRQRGRPPPQRGQGPGDKPSTRHPPLRALARRMDRALTAMSTTPRMPPTLTTSSRLPTRRRFCFFLAHAATIYKGEAFIFYICCLLRVIDLFG